LICVVDEERSKKTVGVKLVIITCIKRIINSIVKCQTRYDVDLIAFNYQKIIHERKAYSTMAFVLPAFSIYYFQGSSFVLSLFLG